MRIRRLAIMLFCTLPMAVLMYGCGSSSKEGSGTTAPARVAETSCAQCHAQSVDKIDPSVTIYTKYTASKHFTNNVNTVGCQDCHGGGSQHNGIGPIQYANPDASGQCFACHKNSLDSKHYAVYPASTTYNAASSKHNAQYVSTNYQNSCSSCHDSHQPKPGQEHKDWAESGHGDVSGAGWAYYDFKFYGTGECTPCHTSTGFINYVSSGFSIPTATFATPGDGTHEVLTCKACHTDYNFKNRIRNVAAVKAMYTYNGAPVQFSSYGASNLCITCHSGRGNTQTAKSTRFQGHHAPAAGTLFNSSAHVGYEFATKSYGNATSFIHDKIGTAAVPNTGTSGPCVTCHMASSNSHKFSAATKSSTGAITGLPTQAVCLKCHPAAFVTPANMEVLRLGYIETAELLKAYVGNTIPNYLAVAITSSNYNTVADNAYGAFQNAMLTAEEQGAFTHNSVYAKRLLFDSIDWMDNGAFNNTITIPAGYPNARTWFGANASGVATRP